MKLLNNPIQQFSQWLEEAKNHPQIELANATCLSTVNEDGFPESRMMLLKGVDADGFVFYTNLNSVKGHSLKRTPKAALNFYWEKLRKQVRIQGTVKPVSDAEANAYFKTRPRGSQIAAWASDQSRSLESREFLEKRVVEFDKKFEGKEVPRPPFWNGFRLVPMKIEFWQEQPSRLHDRLLYTRQGESWSVTRLYP